MDKFIKYHSTENFLREYGKLPTQNRTFSPLRYPHSDKLVTSENQREHPMHSQLLYPFPHSINRRVILTGSLSKLTLDFANFTGVARSDFAMLDAWVKPEHTRIQLETKRLKDLAPNDGTNLLDVSRTLLRIVARLSETEYSGHKSNGHIRRQADEVALDDLPDPASDEATSQG